jgi:hypothetical protein
LSAGHCGAQLNLAMVLVETAQWAEGYSRLKNI